MTQKHTYVYIVTGVNAKSYETYTVAAFTNKRCMIEYIKSLARDARASLTYERTKDGMPNSTVDITRQVQSEINE
jgi:hypothetical protein